MANSINVHLRLNKSELNTNLNKYQFKYIIKLTIYVLFRNNSFCGNKKRYLDLIFIKIMFNRSKLCLKF